MGAYAVRSPTKDVDSNAIGVRVSEESLTRIAHEVAALDVADGVAFDAGRLTLRPPTKNVGAFDAPDRSVAENGGWA